MVGWKTNLEKYWIISPGKIKDVWTTTQIGYQAKPVAIFWSKCYQLFLGKAVSWTWHLTSFSFINPVIPTKISFHQNFFNSSAGWLQSGALCILVMPWHCHEIFQVADCASLEHSKENSKRTMVPNWFQKGWVADWYWVDSPVFLGGWNSYQ